MHKLPVRLFQMHYTWIWEDHQLNKYVDGMVEYCVVTTDDSLYRSFGSGQVWDVRSVEQKKLD